MPSKGRGPQVPREAAGGRRAGPVSPTLWLCQKGATGDEQDPWMVAQQRRDTGGFLRRLWRRVRGNLTFSLSVDLSLRSNLFLNTCAKRDADLSTQVSIR